MLARKPENELRRRNRPSKEGRCSICGERYDGMGNNAAPVNGGRCCDVCNTTRVIPERIARIYADRRRGTAK